MNPQQPSIAEEADERPPPPAENTDAEQELIEALQRERADFKNYKRRVEQERGTEQERGRSAAIEQLLPILDELDRALAGVPADIKDNPWVRGVGMVRERLSAALRSLGVERYGAARDAFDPALHDALFYQPAPEGRPPSVAEVLRPGYRMGNRVLRPAEVVVSGPPHSVNLEDLNEADAIEAGE
jgi:molecular chaperone GrpE